MAWFCINEFALDARAITSHLSLECCWCAAHEPIVGHYLRFLRRWNKIYFQYSEAVWRFEKVPPNGRSLPSHCSVRSLLRKLEAIHSSSQFSTLLINPSYPIILTYGALLRRFEQEHEDFDTRSQFFKQLRTHSSSSLAGQLIRTPPQNSKRQGRSCKSYDSEPLDATTLRILGTCTQWDRCIEEAWSVSMRGRCRVSRCSWMLRPSSNGM
jgi:hypothetical protein